MAEKRNFHYTTKYQLHSGLFDRSVRTAIQSCQRTLTVQATQQNAACSLLHENTAYHVCGHIELCSTYAPGTLLEINSFVWSQAATNINHVHACKDC